MIRVLTGMIALLITATLAQAALEGRVESIGFGSDVRADGWIPMKVSINSDASEAFTGQLLVVQRDLNGDEVVYARPKVTINPGRQEPWVYFKPTPSNGLSEQGSNTADLQKQLRVYLTDLGGRKLLQLAIGANAPTVLDGKDGVHSGKIVLLVGSRGSALVTQLNDRSSNTIGMLESILPVVVDIRQLPDNALGYDMVDSVVWLDADPSPLDGPQYKALTQWINGGGKLVVIQAPQWQVTRDKFGELLPVQMDGVRDINTIEPLHTLAMVRPDTRRDSNRRPLPDLWANTQLPQQLVHAKASPSAWVEQWIDYSETDRAPYIARRMIGLGSVTWVAQDLTDPSLPHGAWGWVYVWQRILGLKQADSTYTYGPIAMPEDAAGLGLHDLGKRMVEGMNLESRTSALVGLAFVFFIGYWAIAGPVSFVVLASRKKTQRSWMIFAAIALGATLLTLLVTRLVLRGSPEIRHVSVVRAAPGTGLPARVMSRFGLYIPRDVRPAIGFSQRSRDGVTAITPYSIPPTYAPNNVTERESSYTVPIEQEDATNSVTIGVPIRSTLKKLQFDWTGDLPASVTGQAALDPDETITITGRLRNKTGVELKNVFIAFRRPMSNNRLKEPWTDWLLYVPSWPKETDLDLAKEFNTRDPDTGKPEVLTMLDRQTFDGPNFPGRRNSRAPLATWAYYCYAAGFRASSINQGFTTFVDSTPGYMQSFVMLSLFDHLPTIDNTPNNHDRADLLRRGTHQWDVSHALECGKLIVLARAEEAPMPAPLEVDGYPPEGSGTTYYQVILPLDYSKIEAEELKKQNVERASTKPTTKPTPKP